MKIISLTISISNFTMIVQKLCFLKKELCMIGILALIGLVVVVIIVIRLI